MYVSFHTSTFHCSTIRAAEAGNSLEERFFRGERVGFRVRAKSIKQMMGVDNVELLCNHCRPLLSVAVGSPQKGQGLIVSYRMSSEILLD